MTAASVEAPTVGGRLRLYQPPKAHRCGCGRTLDLIGIESTTDAGQRADFAMCGTCISTGLAIFLGRQHIERGGQIADLSFGP